MNPGEIEFERIHDLYRAKIQRYLTRMVGAAEAEDLTQEVFVKVSQGLGNFRGECELSTWIYRIATHAAIDRMRTPSFRQDVQTRSFDDSKDLEEKDTQIKGEASSLEERLARKEMYECFGDFVEKLSANYRAVFVLGQLEELSNSEIAEILGLSIDVVKIRLHRARTKMLRELKANCKPEDWL